MAIRRPVQTTPEYPVRPERVGSYSGTAPQGSVSSQGKDIHLCGCRCIPVRCDPACPGPEGVSVLLISGTGGGKGLVFPKGGWETDETVEAAARRETVEEAGVRGQLEEPMLGEFPFCSGKAARLIEENKGRCRAFMYVMHVSEELASWPERHKRTRLWAKRGKREAENQGGRDQPDDDDDDEGVDPGDWQRAPEEVMKTRKIIKARRAAPPVAGSAAGTTSNPFAAISLPVPTPAADPPAAAEETAAAAPEGREPAEAQKEEAQGTEEQPDEAPPAAVSAPAESDAAPGDAAPAPEATAAGTAAGGTDADKAPVTDAGTPKPAAEPAAADAAETAAAAPEAPAATVSPPAAETQAGADAKPSPSTFTFGSAFKASNGTGFAALAGGSSAGDFSKGFGGFGGAAGQTGGFTFASASSGGAFSFGSLPPAGASFPPVQSIFGGSSAAAPVFGGGEKATGEAAEGDAAPEAEAGTAAAAPLKPEEPLQTGEEDEATEFQADGVLYNFDPAGWKERGRGELRVNVAPSGQARLVMRQRGNLRLLLNANLWPEMAVNEMDGGKGATFAVVNATDDGAAEANGGGKAADSAAAAAAAAADSQAGSSDRLAGLTTFAVRFKTGQVLTSFVQKLNVLKKQTPSSAKAAGDDLV